MIGAVVMSSAPAFEPRAVCRRCLRPERVCYCAHITPVVTRTRVILLQHPRERDVPIGTARMASLCLPNAELHVGVHWRGSDALTRALGDRERPAALLYPGPGAIDVALDPPRHPVTLIVVDGTWSQTRKVVRENPELAALPRYALTPAAPSEYRIRKEPHVSYLSTIEALVHVLGVLEGDRERFAALLAPFRAMVETQLRFASELNAARLRHVPAPRPPKSLGLPAPLGRGEDLVCVAGEANAWPYRSPERERDFPHELVHCLAERLGSGETFDLVLAPQYPIAPSTARHVDLAEHQILAGASAAELAAGWNEFVRPSDVIASWGHYATGLMAAAGAQVPPGQLDLRRIARTYLGGKVGTVEQLSAAVGATTVAPRGPGRAGRRLAQLAAVTRHFSALMAAERDRRDRS